MIEYGLVGEKLGHSFSPEIHSKLAPYRYELCEVPRDKIDSFFEKKEFSGINVTIPYKETVIPHLDFISDEAREIGAVNTVVNRDGKLFGYNTDFFGMKALAEKAGISMSGKKVLIVGNGGTSKTAAYTARRLGAAKIVKASRRSAEGCVSIDDAYICHADAEIIINTTPAGMYPNTDGEGSIALCPERFPRLCGALDAVFNPLRTNFVIRAERMGVPAAGGLYMLVAQAAAASSLFTGCEIDMSVLDRIYSSIRLSKSNIVLVGMPACGKSTVGKILSRLFCRELFDSDELIAEKAGMSIPEIFEKSGEDFFRQAESEIIRELSFKNGAVIATGGGAVLREENVLALKRNGVVFFIDRSPEKLCATADRPLSSNRESLERRYRERIDIYRSSADVTVNGDGDSSEVSSLIEKEFFR